MRVANLFTGVVALAAILLATASASAQITWTGGFDITTAAADVETGGTLVIGIDAAGGGDGMTVTPVVGQNGISVDFIQYGQDASDANTGGIVGVAGGGATFTSKFRNGAGFGGSGSDYGPLVDDGWFHGGEAVDFDTPAFSQDTITITGLVDGDDYLIQYWAQDFNRPDGFVTVLDEGAADSPSILLSPRTASADGEEPVVTDFGQFAIGTFTADATGTVTIGVSGFLDPDSPNLGRSQLNAFQLRNLSQEPVPTPTGDFDGNGVVDCADLDGYIGNIGATVTPALAPLDFDGSGTIEASDATSVITTLVETSNGQVGTFPGDLNCDGLVNVLGDAFILLGNLGSSVDTYAAGDINFDGMVDVLGDAFILIGNLNESNAP